MDVERYVAQDLEALADIPNYQRWILGHFRPHIRGRVLEIGAGIGTFTEKYLDSVDSATLLEPAKNLTPRLQGRFEDQQKVTVVTEPLERAGLPEAWFDAVLLINVLEHVDDDRAMLDRIRRLLRPSGTLLLFVPALPWLFGSLDSLVGHRRRYLKPQLRSLVEGADFSVLDLRYFDALGVFPWFVTGRILKQRAFSASAAGVYDKLGVPLGSLAEGLITPPIGKNLLCVAQRR